MEKELHPHSETKLWNKSYIMLLILSTFITSASQMVIPLVSKFAISLGAPLTIAATISSLMSVTALFLRPVSGLFSDRYNRKTIIMISNGAITLCMFLMAIVKTVPALIAVRLLHGVAFSFNGVALMAFNTMFIPKARLGEGMGWMALSNIIAQAFGPNLGIVLVENYGYNVCFAVSAVICLVGIFIIILMPYHQLPNTKTRKLDINSLISLRILPYACIMTLFSAGNGLASSFLVLFGESKNILNIGLFFTASSIAMVAIRPVSGKLVDSKGLRFVLIPSIICGALGFFVLGQSTTLWMVIVAGVLTAIGRGAGSPSIQSTCLRQIGVEKAGVVSSTCYIGQDIGNALAPIIGGFAAQSFGYAATFSGFSFLLLFGGLAIFFIKYKYDIKKYGGEYL